MTYRCCRSGAVSLAALALAVVGCSSNQSAPGADGGAGAAGAAGAAGVPTTVVNEQTSHDNPIDDALYDRQSATQYRTTDVLPDLDVRALCFVGQTLYAGTASDLVRLRSDGTGFDEVAIAGSGAVVDLAALGADRLVAARAAGVHVLDATGTPADDWAVTGQIVAAVATHGASVLIGTDQGVSTIAAGGATPIAAEQGFAVRDLAVVGDVLWIATASGVRRYDLAASTALADLRAPDKLPDDDVRALAVGHPVGEVFAATATGRATIAADGSSATIVVPGPGALPDGDLLAVDARNGDVLTGHAVGATLDTATGRHHYHSLRWIPAEKVTAVALAEDGSRWLGTPAGISHVEVAQTTLADKAGTYEAMNDAFWRMDGFIDDQIDYADPYDHSALPSKSDKDNDGLWTEMNVAAWCFAYKATGDERYYDKARKALDTMLLEIDVPSATFAAQGMQPGFITRSLVRSDEGALFDGKATQSNWHRQDYDGKTYYWKDDTSSDEYTGHFFGIPVFYDVCAKSDAERADIAKHVDEVMSYVVNNDYLLIDLDGKPTSFGTWAGLANAADGLGDCLAKHLSGCADSYGGGGWLNSVEILGYLLASWHITGNDRYYREYNRLAVDERYGEMVPVRDTTLTVASRKTANHSDHELASLAYYTLLRYEPNPERRAKWVQSLRDFYGYEKAERNTLEIAVMASAVPDANLADAARTLREWPIDQRTWRVDNTHRLDAVLDAQPDRFDSPQFTTVFAYDEIPTLEWNGNPYAVADGGNGRAVQSPWPYLLPYWMLRAYGAFK